eukprot:831450-Prorocentrum_lima.AAC.1
MTSSLVGSEMCIRDRSLGTLHVDLTGAFETTIGRGYRYLLILAHRVQREAQTMLIPWVAPLKE